MNFVNLTPHAICLNDGQIFPPSGTVARVSADISDKGIIGDIPLYSQGFGDVQNLPDAYPGVVFIVSAMVLSALNGSRFDVVAPATSHPDVVRNDKGHIVSVPGFVQ